MLTDTLRNRFGLHNGYIGSDNTNVEGLSGYFRGFASNDSDAAVIAMEAGVDQVSSMSARECMSGVSGASGVSGVV